MGMIKRMFRRLSNKLLPTMSNSRNQLVIDHGGLGGLMMENPTSMVGAVDNIYQTTALEQFKSSTRTRRTKRHKKNRLKNSNIPEALLLAAINNLPPIQFHHIYGPNVQLSNNKYVARRTKSFCEALVFSNRVILPNERVYIKVLEIAKGWSGTIRFGFTSVDPATLKYQMPKHVCPDMTNAGHTWARALADEVVRRNSVIHFSYNNNGFIHYGINNQDCGVFHANVNTSQNLWFIVDIYGLTSAVELIDPRKHHTNSDLDLLRFDLNSTDTTKQKAPYAYLRDKPSITHSNDYAPLPTASITAITTRTKRVSSTSASATTTATTTTLKPTKAPRHSLKNQKTSPSYRDNNNNSPPPIKDCPICFERPINCVLYQCGHMCTCYECGVKQWRTQSRTCPICRTVIKDVIKTYLS